MIENMQNGESTGSTSGAMAKIGQVISGVITDRNFALTYVAGRCKTSMAEVRRWMSGSVTPSKLEWSALCVLSRSFLTHSATWEAACVEHELRHGKRDPHSIEPDGADEATPDIALPREAINRAVDVDVDVDHPSIDRDRDSMHRSMHDLISTISPAELEAAGAAGAAFRRHLREESEPAKIQPATGEAIDSALRQGREDRVAASLPPLPAVTSSAPISPPDPAAPQAAAIQSTPRAINAGATRRVIVPADFVLYACKLSRGRFVQIPLPLDLSIADVERIHAFLLTQVDDPE